MKISTSNYFSSNKEAKESKESIKDIPENIKNIAFQVNCFGCKDQSAYIDKNGVLRCKNHDYCGRVYKYSRVVRQMEDTDFEIVMGTCSVCGHIVVNNDNKSRCPRCHSILIWNEEEGI